MPHRQAGRAAGETGPPVPRLEAPQLGEARLPLLVECGNGLAGLVGGRMDGEPVARMLNGLRPHQGAPPVVLVHCVTHRLETLAGAVRGEVTPSGVSCGLRAVCT